MKTYIRKLLSSLLLVLLPASVSAVPDLESFEQAALSKLSEHKVVGASVALIEDRRLKHIYYLGKESQQSGLPVSERSLFQVASISKTVAAWAAMTLVRDGLISLDEPINPYLKRWQFPESPFGSNNVTLRQLLSHTAGLSSSAYQGITESEPLPSLAVSLNGDQDKINQVKFIQPVGEQFNYSGGGYTVIQLLIEELSGQSFAEYAQSKVLGPLEMRDSSFEPQKSLHEQLITPHGFTRNEIQQRRFRAQAAANLHTTAADLSKFAIANMVRNKVLSASTIKQMHTPVVSSAYGDMGLGFFIDQESGLIGHSGSNFGWKAEMRFSDKTGSGIVLMTNSESGEGFNRAVLCHWGNLTNNKSLTQQCGQAAEKREATSSQIRVLTIVLAIMVFLSAISILRTLSSSKTRFGLPQSWFRWCLAALLLGLLILIALMAFTPLGVWLYTSGLLVPFQTIAYAPSGAKLAVILLLSLLALLSVRCLVDTQSE